MINTDSHLGEALPYVPSPYEGKKLSVATHVALSSYWFATNFVWGALLAIMLPKQIKDLYPYDRVQALSVLTAFAAVIALVVPLFAGALSDRCAHRMGRRRPFMVVGMALNVVGLIIMALVVTISHKHGHLTPEHAGFFRVVAALLRDPMFLLLLLSFMIVQAGNNIATAAYSGMIPDLVPEEQRGHASGYMGLMSQLGTLFGVALCGLVFSKYVVFVQYGVICICLVAVGMITILKVEENRLPAKPPKIEWVAYLKSLWINPKEYPDFAWVWITRALVMLGFYAIQPYVPYYLDDVIGVRDSGGSASKVIALILVMSSLSAVYGGKLSDKIGRKRVVYIANGAIAIASLLFIFCRSLESVCLVGAFFGLAFGAYISVDWALGTDVLPSKEHAAKEMAVWHISMTLPQSVAGPIAGFMISSFGIHEALDLKEKIMVPHYEVAGYTTVFVFIAVCFATGAYLLKNVRGAR